MVSKEAQLVIDQLNANRHARKRAAQGKDPILATLEGVYMERAEGDERARKAPIADKLALEYDTADGVRGEWLRYIDADPEKRREKVLLFVHGGGFASGSAASRRHLAQKLSLAAKVDSFSIDYRQSPEYRYPAHLDDCVTAYVWLLKKGYAPQNIILFGESAGANLVLCMGHYLKDHYLPSPGGICAFSPVVDMLEGFDSRVTRAHCDAMIGELFDDSEIPARLEAMRRGGDDMLSHYCTREQAASPYVSPIRGDFTGFPRLMLQVGTDEILYDDSIKTEKKAKAAGVDVTLHVWEGMYHCFPLFDTPESVEVCKEIAEFISK